MIMMKISGLALAVVVGAAAVPSPALAGDYPWLGVRPPVRSLGQAIAPPTGFRRISLTTNGFGNWLRGLPLLPDGTEVKLWTGEPKKNQAAHVAVVDLDVGKQNLQQCADAIMRLRAEYLWSSGRQREIAFHGADGQLLRWAGGNREAFGRYLREVFNRASTASLHRELATPAKGDVVQPGDVLVHPAGKYNKLGHAVLVLDAAEDAKGNRIVLIGQSYTPAQQVEVLVNTREPQLSPWYSEAKLDTEDADVRVGLRTPSWQWPFRRGDVKRFPAAKQVGAAR